MTSVVGFRPAKEKRSDRRKRREFERELAKFVRKEIAEEEAALPPSTMKSRAGEPGLYNGRGRANVRPPVHRASSRVLAGAYPFLAATGRQMRGGVIGEDLYSRGPYALDPWEAYSAGDVRSLAIVIFGTLGTGKSMFAKVFACRLMSLGRKVIVPSDPKGEWVPVARLVSGHVVAIGPGISNRINPLDEGPARPDLTELQHQQVVMQARRSVLKSMIAILRNGRPLQDEEHTALDMALERVVLEEKVPTIPHVLNALLNPNEEAKSLGAEKAGVMLAHALRRLTKGDLEGMFDGPSTVSFDTDAPVVVVDTSALKYSSPEAQALVTCVTGHWTKLAISLPNRGKRAIFHEEAAIGLLNDVNSSGSGLNDKTQQQKLGRDDGVANIYLFHRVSDLDALGDEGSAVRAQALGLVQDTDIRIVLGQKIDALPLTQKTLGLNDTQAEATLGFDPGEGLFLVGEKRVSVVRVLPTDEEWEAFQTDKHAGDRGSTEPTEGVMAAVVENDLGGES